MADDNILALIRERALAHGVDPATLTRIATIESNLDPNARARTSSASGLFQFVDPTWRQYGAPGASPMDPNANADAGARFTAANIAGLRAAGIEPSPGNTYLAHFAGLGGARRVLGSPDTAMVRDVLDPAAIKANPFLANMSVADLRSWAANKMNGAPMARVPGGAATAAPQVAATPGAGAPSQTGQVPVVGPNAATGDDELLRTLQVLSSPMGQQQPTMPEPMPLNRDIIQQQQARIRRARALAAAALRPIA